MRVAAHLEHNQDEHEERHEEVQAVKLRDAAEHERDDRNAAIRIAVLACKKEPGQHIENPCGKSRRRNDGHDPLAIGHVHEGVGTAQMEHDNVQACEETETVNCREVICWFRHFEENLEKTGRFPANGRVNLKFHKQTCPFSLHFS